MAVHFTRTGTSEKFSALFTVECEASNIVYLIKCCRYKIQHMRKMENPLHLRMNSHRSNFNWSLPGKHVAKHFNKSNHTFEDVSMMVIKLIHLADSTLQEKGSNTGLICSRHWPPIWSQFRPITERKEERKEGKERKERRKGKEGEKEEGKQS